MQNRKPAIYQFLQFIHKMADMKPVTYSIMKNESKFKSEFYL